MSEQPGFLCTREGTCPICMRDSYINVGWLEYHCEKCDNHFCECDTLSDIVKKRREYLGWSLEAMACVSELKVATIKKYEKLWPSKKYCELTARLVKNYNMESLNTVNQEPA